MKMHLKQSLKPHTAKLALPTLNYPSTVTLNPSGKQLKFQRSSSLASRALLDEFQRAIANNSTQKIMDGTLSTSILANNKETEITRQNDSISVYIRNELKEVLKNSSEKQFFEELKNNKKKQMKLKSYSKLKEELTNKIHHKLTEPYLKDFTEDAHTEKNSSPSYTSSEVPAPKKPEPVKIFQNEEIQKRINENFYLKTTILEVKNCETESYDSDLSIVNPVEQQLLEKSGGSNSHLPYLQPEQQRCLTERGEPLGDTNKQNFIRYKRQMYGLYVIGNKPYNLTKSNSVKQITNTSIRLNTERSPVKASPLKDLPIYKSRGGCTINSAMTQQRSQQLLELNKAQDEGSSSLSKSESFVMSKPAIMLVGVKKNHNIRAPKVSETCIQIKRTRAKSNPINIQCR